ncbi:MAG: cell division protein FtsL [Hasllibacter sp.]
MRGLLTLSVVAFVLTLAVWAYSENDRTQAVLRDLARIEREIGRTHESLAMLQAEWAFLNRPERLRELAAMTWDRLRLEPMRPAAFGTVREVPYADELPDPAALSGGVLLSGER